MSKKIVVVLPTVEPKKHSARFNATDPEAAVSSIYIKKTALAELGQEVVDKGVRVTIELNE